MPQFKIQRTPSIRRMPTYLHKLYAMREEGATFASCTDLANYINIELIVVRKDIALTGLAGHRRHGYKIDELIEAIRKYIGWDRLISASMIGAGALGSAILGYQDFYMYGLRVETVFDTDPAKIGTIVHGHRILPMSSFHETLKDAPPKVGIICVSNEAAQQTADKLVEIGVKYIWNFANVCLNVPDDVVVQREVIAGGLAVLAAKIKQIEAGSDASFEE